MSLFLFFFPWRQQLYHLSFLKRCFWAKPNFKMSFRNRFRPQDAHLTAGCVLFLVSALAVFTRVVRMYDSLNLTSPQRAGNPSVLQKHCLLLPCTDFIGLESHRAMHFDIDNGSWKWYFQKFELSKISSYDFLYNEAGRVFYLWFGLHSVSWRDDYSIFCDDTDTTAAVKVFLILKLNHCKEWLVFTIHSSLHSNEELF